MEGENQMWTWLAYLTLFLCIIIIIIEYIWLYILSAKSEEKTRIIKATNDEISDRLEAICNSPTKYSQDNEVASLKEYISNDRLKMDILSEKLLNMIIDNDESQSERYHKAFFIIYSEIDPLEFYKALLKSGGTYDKAFACRKLSDYFAKDEIETIRKFAFSKNKDLAYNASITLSVLGDMDGVIKVILDYDNNYELSHRVLVEILEKYSGDFKELASKLINSGSDYIKAITIKAMTKYKYEEFEEVYLNYLREGSINLKIASIKALGEIAKIEYEHDLIISSQNKDWAVRSAAVKVMKNYKSTNIFEALTLSTKDQEWWVRYNAAKTLVNIDDEKTYIRKILSGYDRFAADAVKHALHQINYNNFKKKSI